MVTMNPSRNQRRRVVTRGGGSAVGGGKCSLSSIIIYSMIGMVFLYIYGMLYLSQYSSSTSKASTPSSTNTNVGGVAYGGSGGGSLPINESPNVAGGVSQTGSSGNADASNNSNNMKDGRPSFRNHFDRSEWGDRQKLRRPNSQHEWGHGVQPQIIINKDRNDHQKEQNPPPKQQRDHSITGPARILSAYLEPVDQSTWNTKPLPARQTTSEDLTKIEYPKLNSCTRLMEQFPIDNYPGDPACNGIAGSEGDPFLPWIHDVFPTHDGRHIQFVAENKRRCKTGTTPDEKLIAEFMQPQISLFQHVAVKRLEAGTDGETRYRLASHEDGDEDGLTTRFICQFEPSGQQTLSVFNVNYDYASLRKHHSKMFTIDGHKDGKFMHTAQLVFQCPVPENLIETVRLGTSVVDDYATLFVNLIPIRTPPRYHRPDVFLAPKYKEFLYTKAEAGDEFGIFNTTIEWGTNHVLPKIADSGRWENIPICKPSLMTYGPPGKPLPDNADGLNSNNDPHGIMSDHSHVPAQHKLVSCLWSSTGYTTRGNRFAVNDGQRRLLEWITYNKQIGFDHFYLYDNSGSFVNDPSNMDDRNSLKAIANMFPDDVTYINWPARVCNNNPNNVDSVGDRSSQYAAEASCRLRFGPHVEWIGQFDVDEYFVPMGKYTSVIPLLDQLDHEGMKIISFASWRAWPRRKFIE